MTDQTQTTTDPETETGFAEGWRPNAGDRVVGTVVDISTTDGGYGPYAIVTLKTATGEVAIHAFHTVLRRELARRRPKIGDELDITYVGKSKAGAGNFGKGYDLYRVRSDKDVAGYDWSRDLTDGEAFEQRDDDEPPIPPAPAPQTVVEQTVADKAAENFGDDPPEW
jgi:hypothetical protein